MKRKPHQTLSVVILLLLVSTSALASSNENQDIKELESLNTKVKPCDDFYEFVCGKYKHRHRHQVNENGVVNEFTLLSDEIEKKMKEILSQHHRKNEAISVRKLKTAYKSCINLRLADFRKPMPEVNFIFDNGGMPMLQKPQPISLNFTWVDIGKLTAEYGVPLIFDIDIVPFPISTEDNLITVNDDNEFSPPSMAQPKLETSLPEQREFSKFFQSSDKYIEKILKLLRDNINPTVQDQELKKGLNDMLKFLKDIRQKPDPKFSKILPMESTTKISELQNWTDKNFPEGQMNWTNYLDAVFSKSGAKVDGNTNIYINSSYVYNVLSVVQNTDPKILKNFALCKILLFSLMDSNSKMRRVLKDMLKANNLTVYSRRDYCVRQLIDVVPSNMVVGFSFAAGNLYENSFSIERRIEKARTMIERIIENYKNALRKTAWMDEKSKNSSIKKLENLIILLGLPDFTRNVTQLDDFYINLKIDKWDNYGNMQRLKSFKQAYFFSQMLGKRSRSFWTKSPFDTNAFYSRSNNAISVPLAMIHPIFFEGKSQLMDQSHLGTLIGHEITHGFDNTGRTYNEKATMGNLWSNETNSNFTKRTQCFREQYSKYYVEELGVYVNGNSSLNENLADNGGLTISYETAKPLFFDEYSRKWKNFTPEQMFFIGFGTTFCAVEEPSYIKYSLSKGYPPSKYRVNGAVSNMKQFSRAFNCPNDSPMNPELKCKIWH